MRIILFLLCAFLFAQPLKVDAQIPKELQAQMKEVINELNKQIADLEKQIAEAKKNKEEPEVIREMEEQVAMLKKQIEMMGGVTKGLAKVSDTIFKKAANEDTLKDGDKPLPTNDKKRIAMMPEDTLTDTQLAGFIKKIQAEVERLIPKQDKEEATKIYESAKASNKTSNGINNIANNLWLSGQPEQAIYLLGKENTSSPKHANNLNNYAALLTMAGGEQAAIPILQNLDQNFPNNSTILNNLGQAWYGLGDLNKAKFYLNKAIALFRTHPQANQTKCWIQKLEGDIQGAIATLKLSINEAYTTEKDHMLDKLGGKLNYRDVTFVYHAKAEPLGIEKFIRSIPLYPFEGGTVAERSYSEWYDYKQKVYAASQVIDQKILAIKPLVEAHEKRLMSNPKLLKPFNNHVHITAKRKLLLLSEWFHDRNLTLIRENKVWSDSLTKWRTDYDNTIKNLEECGPRKEAATTYLSKANMVHKMLNEKNLELLKAYNNTLARLALYISTDPSEYQFLIESIKSGILTTLQGMPCVFEVGCVPKGNRPQGQSGPLPDFDSTNCQYKDEIYIPPFTVIKTECNIMTTEIDLGTETVFPGFEVKLKLGMEENLNSGKITKGTIEIGVEAGIDGNIGPVKGELKGGVAAGIEVTRDGVKEVYLSASTSAELTGNIQEADPRFLVEEIMDSKGAPIVGAEAKISWNAGPKGNWGFEHHTTSASIEHFLKPLNIGPR